MYTAMNSWVNPLEREKNRLAICRFLTHSYGQAREQLQTGYRMIREELADIQSRAGKLVNRMFSPVQSFLKDPAEIGQELETGETAPKSFYIYLDGRWVAGHDLLKGPMEENY